MARSFGRLRCVGPEDEELWNGIHIWISVPRQLSLNYPALAVWVNNRKKASMPHEHRQALLESALCDSNLPSISTFDFDTNDSEYLSLVSNLASILKDSAAGNAYLGPVGRESVLSGPASFGPSVESSQHSSSPSSTSSSCSPSSRSDVVSSVSLDNSLGELKRPLGAAQHDECAICGKQYSANRLRYHVKSCKRHHCPAPTCKKNYADARGLTRHKAACLHLNRQHHPSGYKCRRDDLESTPNPNLEKAEAGAIRASFCLAVL
ncbi:hypothetical protein NM208_g8797 [Fusarium decemcellulare]|uniref:Uncharacterized protein n=1 Tax=Fusarium decemcellulare TaxID=57161 RepID=A0ACC1S462_9HYPO|nr:hypothetical protein NM208_g8797 [Fusarium decemcellulare]